MRGQTESAYAATGRHSATDAAGPGGYVRTRISIVSPGLRHEQPSGCLSGVTHGMKTPSTLPAQTPADTPATAAERARHMHLDGYGLHDIASALRVHPEQVRRWLATMEHCEAAAAHARAWSATSGSVLEILP